MRHDHSPLNSLLILAVGMLLVACRGQARDDRKPAPRPAADGGADAWTADAAPPQEAGKFYMDTVDQGDDEFTPGCHVEYSDNQCANKTGRLYGDRCFNGLDLQEWTNRECHPALPYDEVRHYCDYDCKIKKKKNWGICVTTTITCEGKKVESAFCKCLDRVPQGKSVRTFGEELKGQ